VGTPPIEGVMHEPVVVRSEEGVELSLDRQRFVSGDLVTGRIAWPGKHAPQEIHLGVRERVTGRDDRDRRLGVTLPLDHSDASGTPFRFQLPLDLTPSFRSKWGALSWEIYVAYKHPTSFRDFIYLTTPVTIVGASSPTPDVPSKASGTDCGDAASSPALAPAVGRARLREAAARVGQARGWQTDEDSIDRVLQLGHFPERETSHFPERETSDFPERETSQQFSTLRARVHRDQRDLPYLVAEITMPLLMLGLETRARSLFDHLDASNRLFDSGLSFTGRELMQVRAFLAPILEATKRHALSLVHASDARLVIECIDARGNDASLHAFLAGIEDILSLVTRVMPDIPPMREVSIDVEAMRRFAIEMEGMFTAGNCSVRGTLPSQHGLHAQVIVPNRGEAPTHFEVRLVGLTGSFAVARDGMFMRGSAAIRGFAKELDENVSIEAENGEGSAILFVPRRRLVITPQVILAMAGSLLRASQLTSGTAVFR